MCMYECARKSVGRVQVYLKLSIATKMFKGKTGEYAAKARFEQDLFFFQKNIVLLNAEVKTLLRLIQLHQSYSFQSTNS